VRWVFRTLAAPNQYGPLQANLSGGWTIEREAKVLNRADGRIAFHFLRTASGTGPGLPLGEQSEQPAHEH